jgi:hypothetical protein
MKRLSAMIKRRRTAALGGIVAVGGLVVMLGGATGGAARSDRLTLTKLQQRSLSGFLSFELGQSGIREGATSVKPKGFRRTAASTTGGLAALDCPSNRGTNVTVNQNCLNITDFDLQGRGQAQNETAIAQDPNHPASLATGYNDYRRGDGTCGNSSSTNAGGSFTDATMPNGFVRGAAFGGVAREYFQASGDPSVAWDTKGNVYYSCQEFLRGLGVTNNPDVSSGIYVYRSTSVNGASWNFPGRPVVQQSTTNGAVLLDKPYLTVDNHRGSPFRDRVYVTWTWYKSDGTAAIYEAWSNDYGESFSSPVLVSGTSKLCPRGILAANSCDNDQYSQPFTAPDGTLYVVFSNFNNPLASKQDNHYQVLITKSTDGGQTFGPLVRVANYNDLPDCPTYQGGQDPFRSCVPEKGSSQDSVFRAANYPSGAVNPANPNEVVVTIASYISRDSNSSNGCAPRGFDPTSFDPLYKGVKTAGACNNKILYSVSNDAGATFPDQKGSPESLPVVGQEPAQATTDQWFQWAAFSPDGTLAVSYYDRQYGDDELTGASDVSLSSSSDLTTFATQRVTTSSIPAPTQFPDAQGNSLFWGDYSGLSASNGVAHPIWADSRDLDLFLCPGTGTQEVAPALCTATEPDGDVALDENIYTAKVNLP